MTKTKVKILVVDDLPANLRAFERILHGLHAEVICVESGNDALAMVMKHAFAVILMDVEMPGMDGIETTQLIRQDKAYRNIPIIFVAAHDDSEDLLIRGYASGAVDYLYKPLRQTIVASKVRVFLQLEDQRQELIKSRRAMADFAHAASHDLKAPLRHIASYTELLRDGAEESPEEQQQWLNYIHSASTRLSLLIDGMLEFASTGSNGITPVQVDLNCVMRDVLDDLDRIISESDATIAVDELPTVLGENQLLYQVFQNIIGNALKYRRKGVAPVITISNKYVGDSAHIAFSDNGIGFKQERADWIFKPFSRLVALKDYDGSGIGMATVAKIIDLLGGKVTAVGEVGVGSTFTVTLPHAPTAPSRLRSTKVEKYS